MRIDRTPLALARATRIGAMLAVACAAVVAAQADNDAGPIRRDGTMKIRVIIDGQTLSATLDDNATARDLAALLPLNLTLSDYASTEKVESIFRRARTDGAARTTSQPPRHHYYAPWGNLAIFYRDFSDSAGLVRLGAFDGSIDALRRDQPFKVRFEAAD